MALINNKVGGRYEDKSEREGGTRIHGTMCHTPQRPKQSLRLYPIKYCDPASSQIYLASQAFFLNIIEENYNMDPSLTLYPKNLLSDAGAACNMP